MIHCVLLVVFSTSVITAVQIKLCKAEISKYLTHYAIADVKPKLRLAVSQPLKYKAIGMKDD